jgi:hypothetical protein
MLPVKKFRLSDDLISEPIPTLSYRQFVVGKSRLSIEEEQAQRELFWYREELLKIISARWKEVNHISLELFSSLTLIVVDERR